jgi:hypothetical protein
MSSAHVSLGFLQEEVAVYFRAYLVRDDVVLLRLLPRAF